MRILCITFLEHRFIDQIGKFAAFIGLLAGFGASHALGRWHIHSEGL